MSTLAESSPPRILDAGEAALVVEFGATLDPAISNRVLALDDALAADRPRGIAETVPTYRSLMIHYDPLVLDRETLADHVRTLAGHAAERGQRSGPLGSALLLRCSPRGGYRGGGGPDRPDIRGGRGHPFRGDLPGLHVTGSPPALPIAAVCPMSWPSAGARAATTPSHQRHHDRRRARGGGRRSRCPTGWYVVGATPCKLYAPERAESFFVRPGDSLRFEAVDATTFAGIAAREAAGERTARRDEGSA